MRKFILRNYTKFGDGFMIKVLLAFKASNGNEQLIKGFYNEFKKKSQLPQISRVSRLFEIEKILNEDGEYNILIIEGDVEKHNQPIQEEYLNNIRSRFPKLNIVYILNNKYHESNYIRNIYDMGIYNCLFIKDASISNIVYISLNPRAENEAESYYGLSINIDETEKIYDNSIRTSLEDIKMNITKDGGKKAIVVKERIVYRTPKDYQKIIGIYSPYSVGKTTLAVNLAMCYAKNKLNVTLVDTDYFKKDMLYYFSINSSDYLKMQRLYKDTQDQKEIDSISSYEINITKRLKLFTDHRDSIYKVTEDMINTIVRNSESNIVIIDISRCLDNELINKMLCLCDEKIIVADKMLSTLNGIPYKLPLKSHNLRKLKLVINKDINIKNLSNKEIKQYFKDIELFGVKKYSLDFDGMFFIPNRLELIAEAMANREAAYGKNIEFDNSIERIARALYRTNIGESGKKGLLKKIFSI
jgi:cellulose biosynthesis protein BcsQ